MSGGGREEKKKKKPSSRGWEESEGMVRGEEVDGREEWKLRT
jgi:hypothetical protein